MSDLLDLLALVGAVALGMGALAWEVVPRVSPDGQYYMGPDPPRPYGARLLGRLMPPRLETWWAVSWTAIALTAFLVGWKGGWVAAALWLGLAQTRTNMLFPALTDQVGQLGLVLALWLPWPYNLVAVVLGGCANEKAPLFGALLTGQAWMLVGLVPVGVGWWWSRPPDRQDPSWLQAPLREARKAWQPVPQGLALPWGAALVGLGGVPLVAVAVAYAQLLVAQDRARLYQWIGAPVCVAAAALLGRVLPEGAALWVVLLHWLNPWRRVL